eukprot:gene3279-5721_t
MDQFQRSTQIEVKLTSFVHWINQSVDTIIFGETSAEFLDKKWSYISKFDSEPSRIFLFGYHENEYLRVTITFQEHFPSNKVAGEIRFRNFNRSYDLLATSLFNLKSVIVVDTVTLWAMKVLFVGYVLIVHKTDLLVGDTLIANRYTHCPMNIEFDCENNVKDYQDNLEIVGNENEGNEKKSKKKK